MISQITIDIIPYTMVYGVIILALVAFCIVDMPGNPAFANSSTMLGGVLSSMFLAWQTSVMGAFEIGDYNTVLAKLVFVMFTAFGNLRARTANQIFSPPSAFRSRGMVFLNLLLCSHAQPADRGHGRLLREG
jgi:hypothetical protein